MWKERTPTQPRHPRALILAPTRELAAQIDDSFTAYGRFLTLKHTVIFGGVGQNPQVRHLSNGVDILVATPGRLLDLMNQGYVTLRNVEFFVLDEADRMLDMGFIHDIKKIIATLPHQRQTLFFSATMPPQVSDLARSLLHDPVHVSVTPQATTVEKIEQRVFFVDYCNKDVLLVSLLKQEHLKCVLVFTRTKARANKLANILNGKGIRSDAIHGNKSQTHRIKALNDFKAGHIQVLVATDIAARGIDIDDISHVINYDMPNEPESYVHRIGRTARAGAEGTAYSFCAADERNYLRDIERLIKMRIQVMEHPYHSDSAMNATGNAAKPPPRQQWHGHGHRRSHGGPGGQPRHSGHGNPRHGGHGGGFRRRH
jgi:ATP-dependent RNA helicase RhlE